MGKIDTYLMQPEEKHRKWEEWMGLYGIDQETNKIFFPPMSIGYSDMKCLLCLGFDGERIITVKHKGEEHHLADIDWLIKEIEPENKEISEQLLRIKERILNRHKKEEQLNDSPN